MKIIKLSAIDSTNSFLKELAQNSTLQNFTIVVTNHQTNGRGQQGSNWISKPHKNLTFSILINELALEISQQKFINFAVSVAIYEVLDKKSIPKLSIKWPNDIMSGKRKICGILIETTILKGKTQQIIIGIGLNVNQQEFGALQKKVSSLKNITQNSFDLDVLLHELLTNIKEKIKLLDAGNLHWLEQNYLDVLYKKNTPTMFQHHHKGTVFMGCITGISEYGNILIQLEDESIQEFGIKEISFL